MAVVTATQTLDPSARHEDDSQTQRRDFLSICYPQQSLSLISVLLIFSTGFVTSSGLRVVSVPPHPTPPASNPKNKTNKKRDIQSAHIHPSHKPLYLFTRVMACAHVFVHKQLQHCTEVCISEIYSTIGNREKKQSLGKPYLRTSQVMTYKKIYIEKN